MDRRTYIFLLSFWPPLQRVTCSQNQGVAFSSGSLWREKEKEKEGRLWPAFKYSQIWNWLTLFESSVPHALFRFSWNRFLVITKGRAFLKVACYRQTWESFYALWFILLWRNGSPVLYFLLKVKGLLFPLLSLPFSCLFMFLKAEIRAKAFRMSIPFKCQWIHLETGGGFLLLVIPTVREAAHGDFESHAESSNVLSFLDLLLPNMFLK